MLWPEVARESFLEVAALQLDQKNDCFQRDRVERARRQRQSCLSFHYDNPVSKDDG